MTHPTYSSITNTQINTLILIQRFKNSSKNHWVWHTQLFQVSHTQIPTSYLDTKVQEQLKKSLGMTYPTLASITYTQIHSLILIQRYKNNSKTHWVWHTQMFAMITNTKIHPLILIQRYENNSKNNWVWHTQLFQVSITHRFILSSWYKGARTTQKLI